MSRTWLGWLAGRVDKQKRGAGAPVAARLASAARATLEHLEGRVLFAATLLSNGNGDGSLQVTVDAYGAYGSASGTGDQAFYDPVGALGRSGTTFQSAVYFSPSANFLTEGNFGNGVGGLPPIAFTSANTTEAVSTFTLNSFAITLTQTVEPFDGEGTNFVQSYRITNNTGSNQSLRLVRHVDGDLSFRPGLDDFAGVSADGQFIFEFDTATDPNASEGFFGLINDGGTHAGYSVVQFDNNNFADIVASNGIPNAEVNQLLRGANADADLNNDRLTDAPGYDVTISLQNNLSVASGATVTFTTVTRFGQGAPAQVLSPGTLSFTQPTYTVDENAGTATFTVQRQSGITGAVTVDFATVPSNLPEDATPNADYTPVTGTLSFANNERTATFTVPIIDDALQENDERFTIRLSNPTGGATLGSTSTATVTIQDNEPGVRFSTTNYTVTEGTELSPTVATIVVSRVGTDTSVPFTVDYATSDGSATSVLDYGATSGTFTFAAGELQKTFTIPIYADFAVEGPETVNITLSNASNGVGLPAPTATLTIQDLERALSVARLQYSTTTSGNDGVLVTFNQTLVRENAQDIANFDLFQYRERRFGGSPSRKRVRIDAAVYNPDGNTVLLRTRKPLKENQTYEVNINTTRESGVRTTEFQALDGNGDNIPGDDFVGYISRGTRLDFFDGDGDHADIQLGRERGPVLGRMEIFRRAVRTIDEIRFYGTEPSYILFGQVVRDRRGGGGGNGSVALGELSGSPVSIHLDPSVFAVGINRIGVA